jgi:hypothetical protein
MAQNAWRDKCGGQVRTSRSVLLRRRKSETDGGNWASWSRASRLFFSVSAKTSVLFTEGNGEYFVYSILGFSPGDNIMMSHQEHNESTTWDENPIISPFVVMWYEGAFTPPTTVR